MSIRVTIDLLPGGDDSRPQPLGVLRIWREHPEEREVSHYGYKTWMTTGGTWGHGVPHRRSEDVLTLLHRVLTHVDIQARERAQNTPTLFDPPLSDPTAPAAAVGRGAPETSATAALKVYPKTGSQRERILLFLAEHGPAHDDLIQAVLGMPANTERPRRRELVLGGWVEDSGETHRLQGTTGNQAIAWQVTEEGRRRLAER